MYPTACWPGEQRGEERDRERERESKRVRRCYIFPAIQRGSIKSKRKRRNGILLVGLARGLSLVLKRRTLWDSTVRDTYREAAGCRQIPEGQLRGCIPNQRDVLQNTWKPGISWFFPSPVPRHSRTLFFFVRRIGRKGPTRRTVILRACSSPDLPLAVC